MRRLGRQNGSATANIERTHHRVSTAIVCMRLDHRRVNIPIPRRGTDRSEPGRPRISLLERDGWYHGRPADDAIARGKLERLIAFDLSEPAAA